MRSSWRRSSQVRVESATWEDETRLSIVHGGSALYWLFGLIFLGMGIVVTTLPLHVVPSKHVVLFYILVPLFGLAITGFGLLGPFLRIYRVLDRELQVFHHGWEFLGLRRERTLPIEAIRALTVVPLSSKQGTSYRVFAVVELDGWCSRVYLHEFANDEARATQFMRIPARFLPGPAT